MGLGSLRKRHTGLHFPPLLFLTDTHGQEGNVILCITVPCCSGSSHIRGRKGHRALYQYIISPSLVQLQRAIAQGWEGYFRLVLCPTVGAGCGEGPWGHCPVLAPEHTFVHTNMHAHRAQSSPCGRAWGPSITWLHLNAYPRNGPRTARLQVPRSLLLAAFDLGEALILRGNIYCGFYVSRTRVSLHF